MRADEYVVEQLKITEEQLRISKECYNKTKEDYKQLRDQTEKYCKLLDELKQLFVINKINDKVTTLKLIYEEDEECCLKRIVAYNDERVYTILTELLGPIVEEETDGQ